MSLESSQTFAELEKTMKNMNIMLGSGGGGTVNLFYDPQKEIFRVIKELKAVQTDDRGDFTPERFESEKNILNGINHPAILKLFRSRIQTDPYSSPWLEYEFIPFGSVVDLFEDQSEFIPKLDITQQFILVYGIARGMRFLHSRHVIHRDLKPQNIMINGMFEPIIIDFGLAKVIRDESRNDTNCGTPNYLPPEILIEKSQQTKFSFKSDVFSFGITANEIITETPPYIYRTETGFKSQPIRIIKDKIINGERPEMKKGHLLNDLINKCWLDDFSQRPDFNTICKEIESIFYNKFLTSLVNNYKRTKYQNRFQEYKEKIDFAENNQNNYVRMEYGTLANFEYAASLGLPKAMKDYSFFLHNCDNYFNSTEIQNKSNFYIISARALSNDEKYVDYMCTLNYPLKEEIYPEEEPSEFYQSSDD